MPRTAANGATIRPNGGNYCLGHLRARVPEKRIVMKMCGPANRWYSSANQAGGFRWDDVCCAPEHLWKDTKMFFFSLVRKKKKIAIIVMMLISVCQARQTFENLKPHEYLHCIKHQHDFSVNYIHILCIQIRNKDTQIFIAMVLQYRHAQRRTNSFHGNEGASLPPEWSFSLNWIASRILLHKFNIICVYICRDSQYSGWIPSAYDNALLRTNLNIWNRNEPKFAN